MKIRKIIPRPIFAWAGSCYRDRRLLTPLIPDEVKKIWDPMCGAASFVVALDHEDIEISDSCDEVINALLVCRDTPGRLCHLLGHFEKKNPQSLLKHLLQKPRESMDPIERAATLIFITKKSYVTNFVRKSDGTRKLRSFSASSIAHDSIFRTGNIFANSEVLRGLAIECRDFKYIHPSRGDLVFLSPPELRSHKDKRMFLFTSEDYADLALLCDRWDRRGVKFLVTCKDSALVRMLFHPFIFVTSREIRNIDIIYNTSRQYELKRSQDQFIVIKNFYSDLVVQAKGSIRI